MVINRLINHAGAGTDRPDLPERSAPMGDISGCIHQALDVTPRGTCSWERVAQGLIPLILGAHQGWRSPQPHPTALRGPPGLGTSSSRAPSPAPQDSTSTAWVWLRPQGWGRGGPATTPAPPGRGGRATGGVDGPEQMAGPHIH